MKVSNIVIVGLLVGILFVIPNSEAATSLGGAGGSTGGSGDMVHACDDFDVIAVVGTVNAGPASVCLSYPSSVPTSFSPFWLSMSYRGPIITAAGASNFQIYSGNSSLTGCIISAGPFTSFIFPAASGSSGTFIVQLLMNHRPDCTGILQVVVSAGVVPISFVNELIAFGVSASDSIHNINDYGCHATLESSEAYNSSFVCAIPFSGLQDWNCGANGLTLVSVSQNSTACLNPQIDNINRLSANSTWGTATTTPHFLNYNFICGDTNGNESALNSTAVCGPFTATLAGTLQLGNITISSWPTLLANVTNSGAINVTNGGGQNITVSGNLNTNMTGSLNVTMPNGLNVTITSWPQLQVVLSGTLNVTSSCGNTNVTPCYLNSTEQSNSTFNGNVTVNSTTPPDFRSTAAYTQALWTLVLFLLAIGMAEWKKDLFYHLIAVIIGIYGIVTIPTVLGVERMVILGIMLYQIMRIVRIYQTPRNDLQRSETGTDI